MSTTKRLDIRWAAGLYEGEGSCYLARSNRKYRYPAISLASTDRDVLEQFQRIVKGGNIRGPYMDKRFVEPKPIFKWSAHGPDAIRIAKRLRPYVNGRRGAKIDEVLTGKHGLQ